MTKRDVCLLKVRVRICVYEARKKKCEKKKKAATHSGGIYNTLHILEQTARKYYKV